MAEKSLKTRIQLKNDTETNWNKAINFIPRVGEAIVYQQDSNYNFSRLKIGNGTSTVNNLNFINEQSDWNEANNQANGYIKNKPILGTAAATDSSDYATAEQGLKADEAMPKTGGIFTGAVILNSDPNSNLAAATKQYVDNNVSISGNLSAGTEIATITINNVETKLYSPGTPTTISVTQSANTPTLEFINSTNTSAAETTLTGITTSSSLQDGKMIVYRLAYPLNGQQISINLFDTSNNSLGVIPLYMNGTIRCTAAYPTGTMLFIIYYQNAFYLTNPFGAVT